MALLESVHLKGPKCVYINSTKEKVEESKRRGRWTTGGTGGNGSHLHEVPGSCLPSTSSRREEGRNRNQAQRLSLRQRKVHRMSTCIPG
jgi:hypothetical protein